MTMVEYLEKDRERLLGELKEAQTPDKAESVITGEVDRLLLLYNEHCEVEEKRAAAQMMLQTARMAAPLVNIVGDTGIWEEISAGGEHKAGAGVPFRARLYGAIGILCGSGGFAMALLMTPEGLRAADVILSILLTAAGPFFLYLAGCSIGKSHGIELGKSRVGRKEKVNYHIENYVDAQKIYNNLRYLLIAADQNLSRLTAGKTENDPTAGTSLPAKCGSAGGLGKEEIELFSDLLEAALSEDGEYALAKLSDVRFYLHKKQVEAVMYDGSNRELFDFMPAAEARTFRPAMLTDGKLLKKGLASEGRA